MNLFYSQVLQILFVSLVWVWERRWCFSPFSHLLILFLSLCWKVGLRGGSAVKNPPASAGYVGSIPGFGRSPGEGNGCPLQYSCLESSMDRGAWRAYSPWCCKELDMTEWLREILEGTVVKVTWEFHHWKWRNFPCWLCFLPFFLSCILQPLSDCLLGQKLLQKKLL